MCLSTSSLSDDIFSDRSSYVLIFFGIPTLKLRFYFFKDRDSARWGLTPKMVQRRRILFWDLFVSDVWQASIDSLLFYRYLLYDFFFQSLNTGRPPSFSLAYVDCGFPQYDASSNGKGGNFGSSCELFDKKYPGYTS